MRWCGRAQSLVPGTRQPARYWSIAHELVAPGTNTLHRWVSFELQTLLKITKFISGNRIRRSHIVNKMSVFHWGIDGATAGLLFERVTITGVRGTALWPIT